MDFYIKELSNLIENVSVIGIEGSAPRPCLTHKIIRRQEYVA